MPPKCDYPDCHENLVVSMGSLKIEIENIWRRINFTGWVFGIIITLFLAGIGAANLQLMSLNEKVGESRSNVQALTKRFDQHEKRFEIYMTQDKLGVPENERIR